MSGALGSLGASAFGALSGGIGALSGGIGAELTGGNFWQGAVIGGIEAGLNHTLHQTAEPPVKGLSFFKDNTGEYWWDAKRGAYQHLIYDENGHTNFAGYYRVTGAGPKGKYYIIERGQAFELATKDIVYETIYKDVSVEDINLKITLEYGSRTVVSSKTIIRPVGTENRRSLIGYGQPINNDMGLKGSVSIYTETSAYGTRFNSSFIKSSALGIGWDMLKGLMGVFF